MDDLARWWFTEQSGLLPDMVSRFLPGACCVVHFACGWIMLHDKGNRVIGIPMLLAALALVGIVIIGVPAVPARHVATLILCTVPASVVFCAFRDERRESQTALLDDGLTGAKGKVA